MEPASEDEIMAQLRTWGLAAEPISADPADRARELDFLSRVVSAVKSRGDLKLEGNGVSVKAQANLTLEGGGTVKVKGSVINLN